MKTLKNFAQMSTDMFVRFNEQVAERMKDLKIDEEYSNELLGAVHHLRDKNEFFFELSDFWSSVKRDINDDEDLGENMDIMEALRKLKDESRKIYSRKSEAIKSKSVDWLSGVESVSDDMATKFFEVVEHNKGRRKEAYTALQDFARKFHESKGGENKGDFEEFDSLWSEFQMSFLGK